MALGRPPAGVERRGGMGEKGVYLHLPIRAPMSGLGSVFDRTCLALGALTGLGSLYYARLQYIDTHPVPLGAANTALAVAPLWPAIALGLLALSLICIGLVGLRRHRKPDHPASSLDSAVERAIGVKQGPSIREASSRTATETLFLRRHGWFAFWSKWPFNSYKAKRNLEFIDAWAEYFDARKQSGPVPLSAGRRDFLVNHALDFAVAQEPEAIFKLRKTPRQLEENILAKLPALLPGEATPVGQSILMPIRELFFHIHPQPFVGDEEKEAVGREVMDQLSAEQLASWGRRIEGSKRLALEPIPMGNFKRAKFTYWFLDEGNEQSLHVDCYMSSSQVASWQYADLRVNREQAVAIWSYIPLKDAARIAYEQARESVIAKAAERFGGSPNGVLHYLASSIFLYHPVYAELPPSTIRELIPPRLRPSLRVLEDCDTIGPVSSGTPTYVHALVKRSDLDAFIEWARTSTE